MLNLKRTSGNIAQALQARGGAMAFGGAQHWNSDNSPVITGAMSTL
jgi:hypothetical protein